MMFSFKLLYVHVFRIVGVGDLGNSNTTICLITATVHNLFSKDLYAIGRLEIATEYLHSNTILHKTSSFFGTSSSFALLLAINHAALFIIYHPRKSQTEQCVQ